MKKNYTNILLFIFTLMVTMGNAQDQNSDWVKESQLSIKDPSLISFNKDKMPTSYNLYSVNIESIKSKLIGAPKRSTFFGESQHIISVPNREGKTEKYSVLDAELLHPELQEQLPNIRSYVGKCISTPGKYIRFSVSNAGFHAQIFEAGKSTFFIDPYTSDKSIYIAYKRSDLVNNSDDIFSCETDNTLRKKLTEFAHLKSTTPTSTNDQILRTYRLAMSCTGEYGALFIGEATTDFEKKTNIMAQINITMTRVNGIYEKEMGVTYQIVPDNFKIMYYDGATDPWDGEYNDKTQEVIDDPVNGIGDPNYDIGHNFNTDGGGNAGCIGCVCNSGNKGSGMTGRSNPTGDSFDVDYVAHEIGHQMGGYHTHNGTALCLKSGNNTEVEPGSGSSIMGYAGICPGQDVQDNSDDYFNFVNIRDISANIQGGVSSVCPTETVIANNPPQNVDAGLDYFIPPGTAFVLTGSASDPDGDILTYTWEQNDSEDMQTPVRPVPTSTAGPMFRSRRGTISPSRYFPQLGDILNNNLQPDWEVIPQGARDFEFALTVRDNVAVYGQTNSDLMNLHSVVSTDDGSSLPISAFTVTSQNSPTTWIQGTPQTITWNVSNTNLSPVNCANVNILFSASGNFDDTVALASGVPNSGTYLYDGNSITAETDTGRLMIRAADNVFLDVNDSVINVVAPTTATYFLVAKEDSKTVCANVSPNEETFTFEYTPTSGYLETVTFSAVDFPAGSNVSFNPASASATATDVVMTVSNFSSASEGDYNIIISGESNISNESKSIVVTLSLIGDSFGTPTLQSPSNGSVDQSTFAQLSWDAAASGDSVDSYDVEISLSSDFSTTVETGNTTSTAFTPSAELSESTTYYWRVKPKNVCGEGSFTGSFFFTTGANVCTTETNSTPQPIISTFTTTSTLEINDNVVISDINLMLEVTHPYISDIGVVLTSPEGTSVNIISSQCGANPDLSATFDDSGDALIVCSTSSPSVSGVIQPQSPLSILNGENVSGTWTLSVSDSGIGDDGAVTSWSVEYCGVPTGTLSLDDVSEDYGVNLYPNPAKEEVNVIFSNISILNFELFDILGRSVLEQELTDTNSKIDVSLFSAGTYLVKMTTDRNQIITKKLIIE
ncbi:MAG: T9SS type A sorting domain-containing protein [Winogradskyella sp.]|uniref:zinc-dependent metalloprotease family protein n=1 Tax=Winogradskyella sp. TaxID=1883156 RepID=UPI00182FEE16|nr:T9SS type A sorting domain-containing protein [Winogradskyella sp.]